MDFDRHNLQPEDAGGMVDGGMDDTYIDHLNSALDWSEREIARLKAENAKLREQGARLFDKTLELGTENAKLRELVSDMWSDIPKSESCGWDASAFHCVGYGECNGECGYWYRMRELGIEVES